MKRCRNCATTLSASYCPECGQKDVDLERPFLDLLAEVVREAFDIDGRAARTIWALFTRPGVLTQTFLDGHRRQYTPPLRLYLVVSVLFFFVVAWVVRQGILFDVTAESAGAVRVLAESLSRLMVVFLPVFALLLKLAYRQRLYFDHLIHALHSHTAAYVVLVLLLPLERWAALHWLMLTGHVALIAYLAAYLTLSFRRVYGAGWPVTAAKAAAVLFGYTMILAVTLEFMSELSLPYG